MFVPNLFKKIIRSAVSFERARAREPSERDAKGGFDKKRGVDCGSSLISAFVDGVHKKCMVHSSKWVVFNIGTGFRIYSLYDQCINVDSFPPLPLESLVGRSIFYGVMQDGRRYPVSKGRVVLLFGARVGWTSLKVLQPTKEWVRGR